MWRLEWEKWPTHYHYCYSNQKWKSWTYVALVGYGRDRLPVVCKWCYVYRLLYLLLFCFWGGGTCNGWCVFCLLCDMVCSFLSLQTTPLHLIALQCTAINADCLDLEMGVLLMEDVCLGSELSSITCEVWPIYCFGPDFNCASFPLLEWSCMHLWKGWRQKCMSVCILLLSSSVHGLFAVIMLGCRAKIKNCCYLFKKGMLWFDKFSCGFCVVISSV